MDIISHDIGFFDTGGNCPDLVIADGDLKAETGLQNAVLISLWSNQFVELEDLPQGEADQMGWWADLISIPSVDQIGSQLWLSERFKVTQGSANRMRDFAIAALQWMIEDGVARSVNVQAIIVDSQQIDLVIEIVRPSGQDFLFKFVWDGQLFRFQTEAIG